MSQTDKIKIEKVAFLESHSEKFYNELFNKDEDNHSTIILITNLLLKQDSLKDCEEYNFLNRMVESDEQEKIRNSFLSNILTTITQFLTRLGAEDSVKVILSYLNYNEKKEFEVAKTFYIV